MSKLKNSVFTGAATAIITPFKNGVIDYASFKNIIEQQIAGSIDAIVVAGTTGDAATLTHEEHMECMKFVVDTVAGRVPVIAGTGSNDSVNASRYLLFNNVFKACAVDNSVLEGCYNSGCRACEY